MKDLPQNWVIDTQAEKDSPLMPKFMEWFDENAHFKPLMQYISRVSDKYGNATGYQSSNYLLPSHNIITLEQWNAFYFPEWEPKQRERVLVKNFDDTSIYKERTFVVFHNGHYFCEVDENEGKLIAWKEAKPLESSLQSIIENLKAEAKKLGIKDVKITFE